MINPNLLNAWMERSAAVARSRLCMFGIGAWSLLTCSVIATLPAVAGDEVSHDVSAKGGIFLASQPSALYESRRTPQVTITKEELDEAITHYARENHLSPALLKAVIKAESGFNPIIISKAGAVGLMQLIPETAIQHGVHNLYDTRDNIAGGAKHLRYLIDRYHGNVRLALAAYNAGARHVDRYRRIPPFKETQTYVKKVIGFYRDYRTTRLAAIQHQPGTRVYVR